MSVDGNHRVAVVCDECGRESLACKMTTVIDRHGVFMTKAEFEVLQSGYNLFSNAKNICKCFLFLS